MPTPGSAGVIIAFISCFGVSAIVLLEIFAPSASNIQTITIIIGFLTPTVVGLLGLLKSQENANAIKDMHTSTDNSLNKISADAKAASDKVDVAIQNGHVVKEVAEKIAEVASQTAQNVAALKVNGH